MSTSKEKLFNDMILDKYAERIEISREQQDALKIWVEKLERKELIDEKSNYPTFREYILKSFLIFDYSLHQYL